MGDDRLDLITGWNGWKGFAVQRFLNSAFLGASWGRIHSYEPASARGIERKKKRGRCQNKQRVKTHI